MNAFSGVVSFVSSGFLKVFQYMKRHFESILFVSGPDLKLEEISMDNTIELAFIFY